MEIYIYRGGIKWIAEWVHLCVCVFSSLYISIEIKYFIDSHHMHWLCVCVCVVCMQMALKCADICNPCRPWELSKQWSEKVTEEFFHQGTATSTQNSMQNSIHTSSTQDATAGSFSPSMIMWLLPGFCLGDIEKKHKLEVSPLCDSDTNSTADVQIGKNVTGNAATRCFFLTKIKHRHLRRRLRTGRGDNVSSSLSRDGSRFISQI